MILPGVGAFPDAMRMLKEKGLDKVICEEAQRKPLLGICLGMQMLFETSYEFKETKGLGLLEGSVVPIDGGGLKIPHMGWNTLTNVKSDLFKGFTKEEFVYFVHSFYVPLNEFTAAQTTYILPYSSALHKDNFYATQFHPEKSGTVGERILRNFLEL